MFQTEIIVALQTLSGDGWMALMRLVSATGYRQFYVPALLVVLFGLELRRGFVVVQLMLLNAAATEGLKHWFALPRPWFVDANVLTPGSETPARVAGDSPMGAPRFFERLPRAAVETFRALDDPSYGFPSGHVSSAATMWGSLARLFPRRGAQAAAWGWVTLMALSRIFLGQHFVADVLGGAAVGGAFVGLAGLARPGGPESPGGTSRRSPVLCAYLIGAPLALALVPAAGWTAVATLAGLNLGFLALYLPGLPRESPRLLHRVGRVALAALIYLVVHALAAAGIQRAGANAAALGQALGAFGASFLFLWGTVRIGKRLGLYTA